MNDLNKLTILLAEYSQSHQHPTNKAIHWLCVPLIYWNIFGLVICAALWMIQSSLIPNGLLLLAVTGYYVQLSYRLTFIMLVFSCLCIYTHEQLLMYFTLVTYFIILVTVFILLWIMQIVGHQAEGAKPAFLRNLAFLMIGPAWVALALWPTQESL